jgi:hypothetical protein
MAQNGTLGGEGYSTVHDILFFAQAQSKPGIAFMREDDIARFVLAEPTIIREGFQFLWIGHTQRGA